MADSNKLVTMIALVVAGLLVAAWGAIYIWLHRNDGLVLAALQREGRLTAAEVARFTNPTWIWVLSIIQIILGLALVAWGIFQYFVKVDDVVVLAKERIIDPVVARTRTVIGGTAGMNGSRRSYNMNQ